MMPGLEAIAAIQNRLALTLASPPIDWGPLPVEQPALAGFEIGICWTITRRADRVIATAIAEAGAAVIAELHPNDAQTAALLCTVES